MTNSTLTREVTLDTCSWIACDLPASRTWAGKGFCWSCFQEIMDSKD